MSNKTFQTLRLQVFFSFLIFFRPLKCDQSLLKLDLITSPDLIWSNSPWAILGLCISRDQKPVGIKTTFRIISSAANLSLIATGGLLTLLQPLMNKTTSFVFLINWLISKIFLLSLFLPVEYFYHLTTETLLLFFSQSNNAIGNKLWAWNFFCFTVLWIEPSTSYLLGKCITTELQSQL